jgi:cell wall-associated NlpC family hydrolase
MRIAGRVLVVAVCAALGACASRGAVPRPFPAPPGGAPPVAATLPPALASPAVTALLATAQRLAGIPYRNGGSDPAGFDCSGYVQYVFAQHGVMLPRTVERLASAGSRVELPAPGDLLFFATSGRTASHVGIALGDDWFIHAPSSRGVVRVERLSASYWSRRYLEARRVIADP